MVGENDFLERFLDKIVIKNTCWEWIGAKNENGYGYFRINTVLRRAHRIIYEYFYDELDHTLEIHHTCNNRKCVNPIHLEQITHNENIKRDSIQITHCPQGHEYTKENTYLYKNRKICRQCNITRGINWRKKHG